MKRELLLFGLIAVNAFAAKPTVAEAQQRELEQLKATLVAARDSLQIEIADRWRTKQQFVARRENDKEDLDRLREVQEKTYAELSRIKEENLAAQNTIDEARKNLSSAEEAWQGIGVALEEVFAKSADEIAGSFPLDREMRRADLEAIRAGYKRTANPILAIDALVNYDRRYLEKGMSLSLVKQTVLPDTGPAEELTLARYGSVFAYGINTAGSVYIVNQTGRLGGDRFTVSRVSAPAMADNIRYSFPRWIERNAVAGLAPVDVMNSDISRVLVSGKRVSAASKFRQWFRNGGPVMIPLSLVALWAVAIFLFKLIEFSRKQAGGFASTDKRQSGKDHKPSAGVAAIVAQVCLDESHQSRLAAENAIRKVLIDETPKLGRHINTLAVLATAAPLLGLLGTVTGMINLFAVLTQYGNSDPKLVAGGISEALVTTQAGMIIAIPIVLMHNYLRNRRESIVAEMEKQAIANLNRRWPQ